MTAIAWMTTEEALERNSFGSSSADEAAVLHEWLMRLFPTYDAVAFNVRLGEGRESSPSDELWVQRMWKSLTQHRADALGRRGRDVDVVEVKHYAAIQAVTQVRLYTMLAKDELEDVDAVHPVIVCRSCTGAVQTAMRELGGRVVIVP